MRKPEDGSIQGWRRPNPNPFHPLLLSAMFVDWGEDKRLLLN